MNNRLILNSYRPISQGASTAKALMESARFEADKVLATAKEEAEEIKRQAVTKSAEILDRTLVSQRVSKVTAWREAVIAAKEDLLLVAECLANSILLTELAASPDSILKRIEAVNEIVTDLTLATLEISDSESALLRERLAKSDHGFVIKVSHLLTTGEFILRVKNSEIKSSPAFQLENLIREINGSAPTFKQLAQNILAKENDNGSN